jgi:translation initiation factor 1
MTLTGVAWIGNTLGRPNMAGKSDPRFVPGNAPELNNPFANLKIEGLRPEAEVPASAAPGNEPGKRKLGRVVLRRETAHRGGKVVVVVDDFAPFISAANIEELGRKLRHACGCGGTTRERSIELQGEQVAKIRAFLEKEGFRVAGVT